MKNKLFYQLQSKVLLEIKGKNMERFIKRLVSNKIELLKIKKLKYNEAKIIVYQKDYEKILELKSIYEVTEKDIYGIMKMKQIIHQYQYFFIFTVVGICLLLFLSNVIFNVEVVHNDASIRNLVLKELESYQLSKYHFKKNYQDIQNIKKEILNKYKDKIEWLEIEEKGTTYIVRLEDRIIPNLDKQDEKQNVVAKKGAILKKIVATKGEIVKDLNQYVDPGDVVISGNIYLYENVKDTVRAEGTIYGEVWYTITVEYPYIYNEIKETQNRKNVLTVKFLNKEWELFSKPYAEKRVDNTTWLKHTFLPFSLNYQQQQEIITISEVLNEEEAINKALEKAKQQMNDSLKEDEYIISDHILKKETLEDKVQLTVFFSVFENITDYQKIEVVENVP